MLETVLFYLLSIAAVTGGLMTITRRHPLSAALWLVVSFLSLAGLYALLAAQLVAIVQVLVYAGAILALVVFVIMLLNVREADLPADEGFLGNLALALVGIVPVAFVVIRSILALPGSAFLPVAPDYGFIQPFGMHLFQDWLFPFEMVSILLTVAVVGAVVLAKRRI